jgi:hypothetical protein
LRGVANEHPDVSEPRPPAPPGRARRVAPQGSPIVRDARPWQSAAKPGPGTAAPGYPSPSSARQSGRTNSKRPRMSVESMNDVLRTLGRHGLPCRDGVPLWNAIDEWLEQESNAAEEPHVATIEREKKPDCRSGAPNQVGASGAHSNRAIAIVPPGVPARTGRAMLSGLRQITKHAQLQRAISSSCAEAATSLLPRR